MANDSNSLEAVRLISDWGKWLVTIEVAAVAVIGTLASRGDSAFPMLAKLLATLAVISYLVSIAAAAILLLTLPEIVQYLREDQDVWLTRDSVAGQLLGMDTQRLALVESVFFGLGLIVMVAMIAVLLWS
jgi:hypothetical protein